MGRRRFTWSLIYLAFLVGSAPGCLAMQRYRPVSVLVRDAETKQPISGAEINIWYPHGMGGYPPQESSGVTGVEGIAQVRAAPYGDADILFAGSAKGYLTEHVNVSVEAIRKMEPSHLFQEEERRPVGVVVEMYAEPRPTVELVVPTGYRGLVKAKLTVQPNAPCAPGQRSFHCAVAPSGAAEVEGPPLLGRFYPPDYRARYEDGTPLPRQPQQPLEVGLFWLRSDNHVEFFVVGTQADYDRIRGHSDTEHRPAGGGNGGGGGRRHHKSDPTPSP